MILLLFITLGNTGSALDFFERIDRDVGGTMDWAARLPRRDPIRSVSRFLATAANLRSADVCAAQVCGSKEGT